MKLDNQKNGWKGVCVFQETNGEDYNCPVLALARRVVHIHQHTNNKKTWLSTYCVDGKRQDVTAEQMGKSLKFAAGVLDYPAAKGISIDRIDTHSLRSGGANALVLAGYSDWEIQKMGRWRGQTFKEYIREELLVLSEGMSKDMKRKFNFVNITGGAHSELVDVKQTAVFADYEGAAAA